MIEFCIGFTFGFLACFLTIFGIGYIFEQGVQEGEKRAKRNVS